MAVAGPQAIRAKQIQQNNFKTKQENEFKAEKDTEREREACDSTV